MYAIESNPFTGKTPVRVTARVQAEDPAMSDDQLTVSPVRVTDDISGFKTVAVTAKHPATDGTGSDSWGGVISLDLICTSASGDVTGVGYLSPATEPGEQAPSYAKPLVFRGEVHGDEVTARRCSVSPYEWIGGG